MNFIFILKLILMSDINQLKHFDALDYKGEYFTNELKDGGPNDWIYQQVLEAVAVFSSHDNSGISAPWEINLVQKLCNWGIISPLTFKDDEWIRISENSFYQNKRKR